MTKHTPPGFQALTPERRRAIAKLGGTASHKSGAAHEWTSKEAAEAGRKGGKASWAARRARAAEQTEPSA